MNKGGMDVAKGGIASTVTRITVNVDIAVLKYKQET